MMNEETSYSVWKKIGYEILDMLQASAFSFILMAVLSSTIIVNTDFKDDMAISLVALIGGEIMLIASLVLFGRANGSTAYRKTVENGRKRVLGSIDEKVVYKTGEYALWKGVVIGFILTVPFIIIQTVELLAPNTFTSFCLKYLFGWAYYPFSALGKGYQALNYVLVLMPVAIHTAGYYMGKLKQIKIQEALAKTNPDDPRSRVVEIPGEKKGKSNSKGNNKGRKK